MGTMKDVSPVRTVLQFALLSVRVGKSASNPYRLTVKFRRRSRHVVLGTGRPAKRCQTARFQAAQYAAFPNTHSEGRRTWIPTRFLSLLFSFCCSAAAAGTVVDAGSKRRFYVADVSSQVELLEPGNDNGIAGAPHPQAPPPDLLALKSGAIALAPSRMPRFYSVVASFGRAPAFLQQVLLTLVATKPGPWKSELLWIISSSFGPRLLPEFPQN